MDKRRTTIHLALLMLIGLCHGLIYALGVPPWQAPDEPMLFEFAGLTAELGRIPTRWDHSPALERRITESMARASFYDHLLGVTPAPLPITLAEASALFHMPRQVGGDPPFYFVLAALPLRLTSGWSIEAQLYLLRVLNALLLPIVVACTYLAGQHLLTDTHGQAFIPLAAAALVALQPMAAATGAAMTNDALANALGAVLCLLLVRAVSSGLRGRDLLLFGLLAGLGLGVKRTVLPYALLGAGLWGIWLLRLGAAAGPGAWRRRGLAALIGAGLPLIAGLWLSGQFAWATAARWADARTLTPAPRVAAARGGYAMVVESGGEALQVLPDVATVYLRNNIVRAGALVWSHGPASGRLVIYTGERRQEHRFSVPGPEGVRAEIAASVAAYAHDVRLGIVADSGRLYVSNIWAQGVGLPGNLVANGSLARPALRPDSPLYSAVRYLRIEELIWLLQGARLQWGMPVGEWATWLFTSFWGHFGWLHIPLVRGSLWAWALGGLCVIGLAGALAALATGRARRAPLGALLALVPLALLPLALNALIDAQYIQQGRYLLPILPAVALLLALGVAYLAPPGRRHGALLLWLGFWLAFAAAALLRVHGSYFG